MHSQFIIVKQTHGYGAVAYNKTRERQRTRVKNKLSRLRMIWKCNEWCSCSCLYSATRTLKVTWVIHSFILLRRFYVIYLRYMNVHETAKLYGSHILPHWYDHRKGFESILLQYNEEKKKKKFNTKCNK